MTDEYVDASPNYTKNPFIENERSVNYVDDHEPRKIFLKHRLDWAGS